MTVSIASLIPCLLSSDVLKSSDTTSLAAVFPEAEKLSLLLPAEKGVFLCSGNLLKAGVNTLNFQRATDALAQLQDQSSLCLDDALNLNEAKQSTTATPADPTQISWPVKDVASPQGELCAVLTVVWPAGVRVTAKEANAAAQLAQQLATVLPQHACVKTVLDNLSCFVLRPLAAGGAAAAGRASRRPLTWQDKGGQWERCHPPRKDPGADGGVLEGCTDTSGAGCDRGPDTDPSAPPVMLSTSPSSKVNYELQGAMVQGSSVPASTKENEASASVGSEQGLSKVAKSKQAASAQLLKSPLLLTFADPLLEEQYTAWQGRQQLTIDRMLLVANALAYFSALRSFQLASFMPLLWLTVVTCCVGAVAVSRTAPDWYLRHRELLLRAVLCLVCFTHSFAIIPGVADRFEAEGRFQDLVWLHRVVVPMNLLSQGIFGLVRFKWSVPAQLLNGLLLGASLPIACRLGDRGGSPRACVVQSAAVLAGLGLLLPGLAVRRMELRSRALFADTLLRG